MKTKIKKGGMLVVLSLIVITMSGCKFLEMIQEELASFFSSDAVYNVSVIDCKHFTANNRPFAIEPKLAGNFSNNTREGVVELSKLPKYHNIKLVDRIPPSAYSQFQNAFFSKKRKTQNQARDILKAFCKKYNTNIIIWSASFGDDTKTALNVWLYRKDIDSIAISDPVLFTNRMDQDDRATKVRVVVKNLLKQSVDSNPLEEKKSSIFSDRDVNLMKAGAVTLIIQALKEIINNAL